MIFDFFSDSRTEIIFLIFLAVAIIQIFYFWFVFGKFAFAKKNKIENSKNIILPITIIVSARNEYKNLEDFLPKLLEQDYPEFEVLLLNDDNEIETNFIITDLKIKYKNLRVVDVNSSLSYIKGKKFDISIGIKTAKYNHIIFTDVDCYPETDNWLKIMQNGFSEKKDIVIGYSRFETSKGFLNKLIRFDTVSKAIKYFSFTKIGIPYMAFGQNLAYTRPLFNKEKGFVSHYNIPYGDDDLFINKAIKKRNASIVFDKNAHTISIAPKTWEIWYNRKFRHFFTKKYYRFSTLITLAMFNTTKYLFFSVLIYLSIILYNNYMVLSIIGAVLSFRLISFLIIYHKSLSKLNEKKLFFISPFLEIYFMFLNPILFILKFYFYNKGK